MLTLAMPQSDPPPTGTLGFAQVGGEDRRGQALRHGVVQRRGFVEASVYFIT
jgi:hypothetical protein